jgi:hypothetical protein
MKKEWAEEEIEFLKNNYPKYGREYCYKELKRTKTSVAKKVQHLNLKKIISKSKYLEENFIKNVKESKSYTGLAKSLKLSPTCGNIQTVKKYIKKYNIDISHFDFGRSNSKNRECTQKKELSEILVENSTYSHTALLKERLYNEGLKERKCELCGQGEIWMDKNMSLILDHINGINDDHRIDNLRIICANCGATLSTHCGKNRNLKTPFGKYIKENKKNHICKCGKSIDKGALLCEKCSAINRRKVERPPLEQLLKEVKETSYCAVGRNYGVSDNAIRKWIKSYEKSNIK